MKILVTGGAGYIGSTICSALEDQSHTPVILDSLVNGKIEFTKNKIFYKGDIADWELLQRIFKEHPDIYGVIHCAALIVVPESAEKPYEYYRENVAKSNELFYNLIQLNCHRLVFSSSAAIYGYVPGFKVNEKSPIDPQSPYARTKFMIEMLLQDFCHAYPLKAISLRYFNPIGADPKMRSGMYVKSPSHVLGKLLETAYGRQDQFSITGNQWPTPDGTGIRDYIHVWDLACAHIKAIENFDSVFQSGSHFDNYAIFNLGTGKGVTVLELVKTFEKVIARDIPKKILEARPGDVAGSFADPSSAQKNLKWHCQFGIEEGISDALKWYEVRTNVIGN